MGEILTLKRCAWALASQQYIDYHDQEWGVPVHDDRKLFEMMILEGVQAGLTGRLMTLTRTKLLAMMTRKFRSYWRILRS